MSHQTQEQERLHKIEQERLHKRDTQTIKDAIGWLTNFWWANRMPQTNSNYHRDKEHAEWETDRAIHALLNLKSNPPTY